MQYIISHPKRCALKQTESKLILTMKEVSTVTQALEIVRAMAGTENG
jgi:hypothetical protein